MYMLRGYHPSKEMYRWYLVLTTFVGLLIFIVELENGISQPISGRWLISFIILPYLLFLIIFWPLVVLPLRREQKKLFNMRSALLNGQDGSIVFTPVDSALGEKMLPCSLRTQFQSTALHRPAFQLFFVVAGILLLQLPLFLPIPSFIPRMLWIFLPAVQYILLPISGLLLQSFRPLITEFYLLPQLDLDESGITAQYERDTVRMAWQQVRYFALVERKKICSKPGEVIEVYEICDGENTINWPRNPQITTRQPMLLPNEYTRLLSDRLPALVSAKTGLPLLDLREPKRKKKPRI